MVVAIEHAEKHDASLRKDMLTDYKFIHDPRHVYIVIPCDSGLFVTVT